jgi:hypothetical protein
LRPKIDVLHKVTVDVAKLRRQCHPEPIHR